MPLDATIAIPTWNRAEVLRRTLESLAHLRVPPGARVELLVVDNNSPDHTRDVVADCAASLPFAARCVVETRQGLNHGRNRCIAEARSEHVVFLDDDIEVAPGWLECFEQAVAQFAPDCVVGPVVPRFPKVDGPPLPPEALKSLASAYTLRGDRPHVVPEPESHEVPGCNFAVRRDVALSLGGFHPMLDRSGAGLLAGGDSEFGLRLRRAGHRVVHHPGCSIVHVIPPGKLSRAYLRRRHAGQGLTFRVLAELHPWAFPLADMQPRFRRLLAAHAVRWPFAGSPQRFSHELEMRRAFAFLFPGTLDLAEFVANAPRPAA